MSKPNPMQALKATYTEARHGREAAQALAPLLTLLDTVSDGHGDPLQEVNDLLRTIVSGQEQMLRSLEILVRRLDARPSGKR